MPTVTSTTGEWYTHSPVFGVGKGNTDDRTASGVFDVKGERDKQAVKGIARANTDYILGNKVSDIKVTTKAFEWWLSDKVPINYKRQLTHYMYVLGLSEASIIAYQVNDELLNHPFAGLDHHKLYEIPVNITEKEIQQHKQRIEFLEYCRELNIFPR